MPTRLHVRTLFLAAGFCLAPLSGHALILFSGDNAANQSDPGTGVPWTAVGWVGNSSGGGIGGSTVRIRGKYLLTANHVGTNGKYVSFDGNTYWQIDPEFSPRRLSGSVDLKLIKLTEAPDLPEVALNTSTSESGAPATVIGCGFGRNPDVESEPTLRGLAWPWGGGSTLAKRWGSNAISGAEIGGTGSYSYDTMRTELDSRDGDSEAALATYDSGGGLFIQDNGTWVLAGISAYVTFGYDNPENDFSYSHFSVFGDRNYFVRISSYAAEIESLIPDTDTLAGWKVDLSLYGTDADDGADTDGDGITQLLEFALGGDPHDNNRSILPTSGLVDDAGELYLQLSYTKPTSISGIDYTVKTTTDVNIWPTDSTGVEWVATVDNNDGTETHTYRRSTPISGESMAFITLEVSTTAP